MESMSQRSPNLVADQDLTFESGSGTYFLPRYTFIGPRAGGNPIHIGVFAGLHGDEPEGTHALNHLLTLLEREVEVAKGYLISFFPICNPTGFEDGTRFSRRGMDLNREFWRLSEEPEVRLLESCLLTMGFHGIVALHTDDTSDGFYGYAPGATLAKYLLEPALAAAEDFLPRNRNQVIDGFRAENGVIRQIFPGVLSAPPRARPKPFEIVLETPKAAPAYLHDAAFVAAVRTILVRYRELISFAADL
jgi:hypothetical protein